MKQRRNFNKISVIAIALLVVSFSYDASAFQKDSFDLKSFSNAFIEVSNKVSPAVVRIETVTRREASGDRSGYDRFFRRQNPQVMGLGSGFIIDPEGYILTNNHVVEGAEEITVRLPNKYKYEARLVGTDPLTDVAMLKIEGRAFPHIPLGDSNDLQVGEWVLAIGSPNGLTSTVTKGIVSAIGRSQGILLQRGSYRIENFIQTDAAINRGNSGGPLINLDGKVIGINTAILSETGGFQGYGFAVPVNLVKNIAGDLRRHGRVVRGVIGISLTDIADQFEMAELKLNSPDGVKITGFPPGTSAGKDAGLRENDVIIEIDGKRIQRTNQLQTLVSGKNPGDRINLTVMRNGSERNISVRLQNMPDEQDNALVGNNSPREFSEPRRNYDDFNAPELGLNVEELGSRTRRSRSDRTRGVQVTGVMRNSQADQRGIVPGDQIYKIDEMEINSLMDFRRALRKYGRDRRAVAFYIRNEDGINIVPLRINR